MAMRQCAFVGLDFFLAMLSPSVVNFSPDSAVTAFFHYEITNLRALKLPRTASYPFSVARGRGRGHRNKGRGPVCFPPAAPVFIRLALSLRHPCRRKSRGPPTGPQLTCSDGLPDPIHAVPLERGNPAGPVAGRL